MAYPRTRFHTSPHSNVFMPGNGSGCSMFARGSGINDSRYRGTIIELLVASLLSCGVRRHDDALICATRRAVSFPRPRGFATAGTQKYHAQACSLGVPEPGVTEPTLALQSAAPQVSQPPSRQVPWFVGRGRIAKRTIKLGDTICGGWEASPAPVLIFIGTTRAMVCKRHAADLLDRATAPTS